jgi:esterase/lipase superfamily enzyme
MGIKQFDKIVAKNFWAVQLTDSEHRKWTEIAELGKLTYHWEGIPVYDADKLININIAVAKVYPEYDKEKIKKIAKGIYDFSKIEKGDGILGINGERVIERVGLVTSEAKLGFSQRIELNINWVRDFKPDVATAPVFDRESEVQKVTPEIMKKISVPIEIGSQTVKEGISAIDTLYLKEVLPDKLFEVKDAPYNRVVLFYGTNRNRTGSNKTKDWYGSTLTKELIYGICTVTIPKTHIVGELDRPLKIMGISFRDNPERHIVLETLNETSEKDFVLTISQQLSEKAEKSALIFVHGYNVTFHDAALRTAQIAADIPFDGISGFFSWPSAGKTVPYLTDDVNAQASGSQMEKFLDKLISDTGLEQVHILAHSMGNIVLTATLKDLSDKSSWAEKVKIINQIILAAPDIDQDVFTNQILPYFKNVGIRRTLYASGSDEALAISQGVRGGKPKLGQAGEHIYVANGIDTIDASNVPSRDIHHSYIFEADSLLADLFALINDNKHPSKRRLIPGVKNGLNYWLFPVKVNIKAD